MDHLAAAGSIGLDWIVPGLLAAFFFIFFVLFPLLIFITALVEKLHVRELKRIGDVPGDSPVVAAALAEGLIPLGLFTDGDKGIKEGRLSLFISEDGQELLWILHRKASPRHGFTSRLPSGKWLATSSMLGATDISGLEDEQMLPDVPLGVLRQFHRQRLSAQPEGPVSFEAGTVTGDLLEAQRQRMRILLERGLARRRTGEVAAWSYSFKGALRMAANVVRNMRAARRPPAVAPAPVAVPAGAALPAAQVLAVGGGADDGTAAPVVAALAPPPVPDVIEAATLAELDRIGRKRTGWVQGVMILAASFLLFILAARGSRESLWSWEFLLLVTAVLLVHELGHYLAMRLFGYRNLRMFFIPFVGAAVSGQQYNVPGWKKVIVSLAGPLPGIVLGIGLGLAGMLLHRDLLVRAGTLSLILNGLNLLPILPLDGGWVVHTLLFARHHMLDIAFRIGAAVILIVGGFLMPGSFLQYIGIATLITLPAAWKRARLTCQLRREGFQTQSGDGQTVPPDAARLILTRLRQQSPKALQPKAAAQHVLGIFESLNARPPGIAASIGFLSLHGGAFAVAVTFAILLTGFSMGWAARGTQEHAFTPESIATAGRGPLPGDYDTIVLCFSSERAAQAAMEVVRTSGDAVAAMKVARALLISCPADDAAVRTRWFERWQGQAKDAFIERPKYSASLSLSCAAGSEEEAKAIQEEANAYFTTLHYGALAPPWAPPADYPPAQRAADLKARQLVAELHSGPRWESGELANIGKRIATAQKRGDDAEADRLREQMKQTIEQTQQQQHLDNLKARHPGSPVIAAWVNARIEEDPEKGSRQLATELAPHLGLWPARNPAGILAKSGYADHNGRTVQFLVSFNHIDQGIPALVAWLQDRGCSQFTCALTGQPEGPFEDEEDR